MAGICENWVPFPMLSVRFSLFCVLSLPALEFRRSLMGNPHLRTVITQNQMARQVRRYTRYFRIALVFWFWY